MKVITRLKKLQTMKMLMAKYLVLFQCAHQYVGEIEHIMNQPSTNNGI
jgi:hypothetical protein